MPSTPQTLLIVDDHPLFRKGVIQLIQAAPEFRFVGEAASGREGIDLARRLQPDMILLDLNMKDMNGVEVLRVLKDMEREDLMRQLVEAAHGKITISERLTQLLVASLRDKARPISPSEAALTEQEGRILDQLIAGKSNKLIARDLGITEGTVKVHVKHVLKKLNLRSRVEAAVWADRARRQAKL